MYFLCLFPPRHSAKERDMEELIKLKEELFQYVQEIKAKISTQHLVVNLVIYTIFYWTRIRYCMIKYRRIDMKQFLFRRVHNYVNT